MAKKSESFDPIRVSLVIDTPHEGEPGTKFPEKYKKYFEVTRLSKDGSVLPFMSIESFKGPLDKFWKNWKNNCSSKDFPFEILGLDYDLSQALETKVSQYTSTIGDDGKMPDEDTYNNNYVKGQNLHTKQIDFDGLLLGIFYATLTYSHPMGVVPMSYRMDEMSASVFKFQELTKDYLGIDFTAIDKHSTNKRRTWDTIIMTGVKLLQNRIEQLYTSGDIIISISDLMKLSENPSQHEVLTIVSTFASRRLPIQGLFINIKEEDRNKEIKKWAERLLIGEVGVAFDLKALGAASDCAKHVWEFYEKETELIKDRMEMSALVSKKRYVDLVNTSDMRTKNIDTAKDKILTLLKNTNLHNWIAERASEQKTLAFHARHNKDGINRKKINDAGIATPELDTILNSIKDWDELLSENNKYDVYRRVWGVIEPNNIDEFFSGEDNNRYKYLISKYNVNVIDNKLVPDDRITAASLNDLSMSGQNDHHVQHLTSIAILARMVILYSNADIYNMNWQTVYHALFPFPSQPLEYPWHKGASWTEGNTLKRCDIHLENILKGIFDPGDKRLLIGLIADYINAFPENIRDHIVQKISKASWCISMLGHESINLIQKLKQGAAE